MVANAMFGVTLSYALAFFATVPRDIDVFEGFAGVGAIASAATAQGFAAVAFDKFRIPGVTEQSEDLTTAEGFSPLHEDLAVVMRLRSPSCTLFRTLCISSGLSRLKPCSNFGLRLILISDCPLRKPNQ